MGQPLGAPSAKVASPSDVTEPRSILIGGRIGGVGAAVSEILARPGARIAIAYEPREEGAVLETAIRTIRRGAIVLPISTDVVDGEAPARSAVERVVDAFGRLDAVVLIGEEGGEFFDSAAPETPQSKPDSEKESDWTTLRSWVEAAVPHLRRSRPKGHLAIVIAAFEGNAPLSQASVPEQETNLGRGIRELLSACHAERGRICANIVLGPAARSESGALNAPVPSGDNRRAFPGADEIARTVRDLFSRYDARAKVLRVDAPQEKER
ncbi:MAG TPA: hypothetical protein VM492_17285 [Sumerlaeia bacterium]|nr:hypothetical protein [Sumerlaeia bacterium]